MNKEKYFIITVNEDGTKIEQITEGKLIERITPDEFGNLYYGKEVRFLDNIPRWNDGYLDMEYGDVIIIKGDYVIPKAKQVVTKYEL